jgi:hypothetical protein
MHEFRALGDYSTLRQYGDTIAQVQANVILSSESKQSFVLENIYIT